RAAWAPNDNLIRLSGWPANFSRNTSDQATVNPQLAGASGAVFTPAACSVSTHSPPDPSRGQLAPPSASTVASASAVTRPSGAPNTARPDSSQPVQKCRGLKTTPRPSSRRSQARRSGDDFIAFGNTRPLLPTKVGCPSPFDQARSVPGGNASIA